MSRLRTFYHHYLSRPYKLHIQDDVGHGPVIIFLHGIASSSANWQHLMPLLHENYRCITIDLLGFGQSPKPHWSTYSMNQHVRSIHHTIKGLNLSEPYILVGHSLGALLASRYARMYRQEITRLFLLSLPIYLHPTHYGRRRAQQTTNAYLRLYRFLRTHKEFTLKNVVRLSRIVPSVNTLELSEATWLPFTRSLENCIETQTAITDIAELHTPVDIFYGTRDQLVRQQNLAVVAAMRHVTTHTVKGATHVIRQRYAAAVAEALTT